MIHDVPSIPELLGGKYLPSPERFATPEMTAHDYAILGGALLALRPKRIFEIGTYHGATAQLMLYLLSDATVTSIACLTGGNDMLPKQEVGKLVKMRERYYQLYGDSHKIGSREFISRHGKMDFIFIDGDHSAEGVGLDTELALKILVPEGYIFWHDAGQCPRWPGVEQKLQELPISISREGHIGCYQSSF